MTKTDYRQFIDEVYFIGKQKEFSGVFNKIIPSLKIFKSAKENLLNKKKAYDFAIANLFRKYGLDNDNLYDELDKIWESLDDNRTLKKFIATTVPLAAVNLNELQEVFKTYIDKTKTYSENFAKGQIDE